MMTVMERTFTFWVFVILVSLIIWQYNAPDQANDKIGEGIEWVKGLFGNKQPTCPATIDVVCANLTQYDNSCWAQQAGETEWEPGPC